MKKTWPAFADDELKAVERVLRSGRVNQWTGGEVSAFEEEFAKYVGADHAIAFANGSLALEAAYACLGLPQRSEVIIPCRTFVATAMAAARAGLVPVFCDVGDDGLANWRNKEEVKSPRTSAVVSVHLGGKVADTILGKLPVIEDCAQAMGARREGQHVGTFGKVGIFSFCQDKILTTGGEGGMCVTNDYLLARRLWSWKDHGKNIELAHANTHGGYNWCHWSVGTNARMTEMQAAIGRVQLKKVDGWVKRRRQLAERLHERLQGCRALRTVPVDHEEAAYRYYAYTDEEGLSYGWSRERIVSELLKRGIECGSGACPEVYREQAFHDGRTHCLNARKIGDTSIMFKLHPLMTDRYIDQASSYTRALMEKACLRSA